MELPKDILLQIIGEQKGFRKVRFSENVVGYMALPSLEVLPFGTPLPVASIGSIATLWDRDWVQVRVNMSERIPFRFEQRLESSSLEVIFYRARQGPQWIRYPQKDETIRTILCRQESSDRLVLRIDLNQKQQWGFYGRYVGKQFWLNIRKTPQLGTMPGSILDGLTIAVDAGHGGEFEGAVSPTGLFEKNVNLNIARKVGKLLEMEGAQVIMTRMRDTTMTLQKRLNIARAENSHIFLSLHNNSIGAATNPLRPRGTSIFHTVPQSEVIAKHIFNRILELDVPPFGRVLSTYYVTRQTDLLSLIVEGLFMTHPEDEMMLLDETFLDQMAHAVVEGVKDFTLELIPKERLLESEDLAPTEPDTLQRSH